MGELVALVGFPVAEELQVVGEAGADVVVVHPLDPFGMIAGDGSGGYA